MWRLGHLRVFWEQQCSGSSWGCRWTRWGSKGPSGTPSSLGTTNPDNKFYDVVMMMIVVMMIVILLIICIFCHIYLFETCSWTMLMNLTKLPHACERWWDWQSFSQSNVNDWQISPPMCMMMRLPMWMTGKLFPSVNDDETGKVIMRQG